MPVSLMVVDVGYVIERQADFLGRCCKCAQFPARTAFTIPLHGLASEAI